MLAGIRAGAKLKKIEDTPPPKAAAPKKMNLLDQIKLGKKLKSVNERKKRKSTLVNDDDVNLLNDVQKALKRYRE